MSTRTLLRSAALALVIAVAMPAPASPQIGGFLKKKMKEKIAQTLGSGDTAAAAQPAGGAAAPGNGPASRVKKGAAVASGPTFSESMLEITPALLDRFEKGVAAEAAESKKVEAQVAKFLPMAAYERCQQTLWATPEAKAIYREYAAKMQGLKPTDQQAMLEASKWYGDHLAAMARPKCGPTPSESGELTRQLRERPPKAGLEASGLTEIQFAILKERIVPFCKADAAGAGAARLTDGLVYGAGEMEALRPRCARLSAALS